MKHFKRSNMYKASNVTFNPETNRAHSYDWWCFVREFNGKIVFNNYNYSNTTRKHQGKVRQLLRELGINIDLVIECPQSLNDSDISSFVKSYYSKEIVKLEKAIAKPRSHKKKNIERAAKMQALAEKSAKFAKIVNKDSRNYLNFFQS